MTVAKFEATTELNLNQIEIIDTVKDRYLENAWKEDTSFKELVNSIKEQGIITPLIFSRIDKNKFEIIAGRRRLAAIKELHTKYNENIETIPARVLDTSTPTSTKYIISYIENLQRVKLPNYAQVESLLYAVIHDVVANESFEESFGYSVTQILRARAEIEEIIKQINNIAKNQTSKELDMRQSLVLTSIKNIASAIKLSQHTLIKKIVHNSLDIRTKILVLDYNLNADYAIFSKGKPELAKLLFNITEIYRRRKLQEQEQDFKAIAEILASVNMNIADFFDGKDDFNIIIEKNPNGEYFKDKITQILNMLIDDFHCKTIDFKNKQQQEQKNKLSSQLLTTIKNIKDVSKLQQILNFAHSLEQAKNDGGKK